MKKIQTILEYALVMMIAGGLVYYTMDTKEALTFITALLVLFWLRWEWGDR